MSLLDYYRQFEGMSEEEVNEGLRARSGRAQAQSADARGDARPVPDDLARAAPSEHRQRDHVRRPARDAALPAPASGSQLRDELAERHGVEPGAGDPRQRRRRAAQLRHARADRARPAAADAPGPPIRCFRSWPAAPTAAAVPVPGGVDALLEASAEPGTRVVALASPNDPTGELLPTAELERLLAGLPDDVAVLLDESLVEFADAQPVNSSLALLERALAPVRGAQLLQGLGPGRPARRLRPRRTRLGGAAGRAASPTSASPRSPRPARSRRCAAARRSSPGASRAIVARARRRDRRPARARLRGGRQPGQLRVGRPSRDRGRRAVRAPGPRRHPRRRRRGPRRAAPRAHRACATPPPPHGCSDALDKSL